jgi:hypothetical protein
MMTSVCDVIITSTGHVGDTAAVYIAAYPTGYIGVLPVGQPVRGWVRAVRELA